MLMSDEIESMERRLTAGRRRLLRRVRTRIRLARLTATVAVLLVAGSAVATTGAGSAHGRLTAISVTCFDRPSLQAAHLSTQVTLERAAASRSVQVGAQRACDDVWSARAGDVEHRPGQEDTVICRLADGVIGVFRQADLPGGDRQDCDDLGLAQA